MKNKIGISLATTLLLFLVGCKADTTKETATTEKTSVTSESKVVKKTVEKKDPNKDEYEWNGHVYEIDVVSGATTEAKQDENEPPLDAAEKEKKMYWSGRPKVGTIVGNYYNNKVIFNEGYTAVVDVVVDNGKISLVEFDEIGPGDYYDGDWAGMNKRLSGYAFFQASKPRTDKTLVTLVNTMTYLENQMIEENRLTGTFKTLKGSSNSANEGFIPAVNGLAEKIKQPSTEEYYGITKDFGEGLFGRLVVITDRETKAIKEVKYDEYFADMKEEIADKDLQKYYRQSKYYSKDYSKESGENFRKDIDELKEKVLTEQKLDVEKNGKPFENNYQELTKEMSKLLSK